jgi:hypothetical protein
MLWQDADVADVSTVATEWAKHRTALSTHAEVLREQVAALRESWQGAGAEEAAKKLETLAARVEKISELARAGELAAQEAADALATARVQMPAPPGTAPVSDAMSVPGVSTASVPGVPTPSSTASLQSYMSSMQDYLSSMQSSFGEMITTPTTAASTTPSSAGPDMGAAFGAVGSGGYSFYVGATTQDQQKAQAVRAMQTYESSLSNSSKLIGDARSAVPAAAPAGEQTTPAAQAGTGVPWQQLVGGGGTGGALRTGAGTGAVVGGVQGTTQGSPLGAGAQVGALPRVAGAPGLQAARLAETAAARAAGPSGMVPPVGQRGASAEDEKHENRMPTLDHGLFALNESVISAVIDTTGGNR